MPKKKHDFHILEPSPLPVLASFAAFSLALGIIGFISSWSTGIWGIAAGILITAAIMTFWWRDVIKEAIIDRAHNKTVQKGLRIGMALFILSEIMIFAVFFASFFNAWLDPVAILEGDWPIKKGIWPPPGIEIIDPWDLPFTNTLILLLSGTTMVWAQHALMEKDRKNLITALSLTIILGIMFTGLQAAEYLHASFRLGQEDYSAIYPSNFFIATGFHGAHVIIGTIFIAICLARAIKGHFDPENHLGFEFAAWYWQFVDVVWLFLFVFIYWFGS
ncbi:putative cytochrome c oxidase subunit 3 [Rickettsiales bacterium]|nr:putative cytochrome c oxidase subunit 3 [Rickettsiales bacterium]